MHGGVIGGLLPSSLHYVTSSYRTSISANPVVLSGLDFGAAVTGINEKWGWVSIVVDGDSTVNFTSATIGGISGSVIYQATASGWGSPVFSGPFTLAMWTAQIDSLTSGVTVQFSEDTSTSMYVQVGYAVNIDMSAVVDSAVGGAVTTTVSLSIDCPAKGAIIGHGQYGYSGAGPGIGNVGGGFANLDLMQNQQISAGSGSIMDGSIFSSAQTGLDVSFTPTPSNSYPSAYAVSFAGV